MIELDKLVRQCGVELYGTEVANENARQIYRVYITKDGGVSLDECEAVSRLLSPIYDTMPPLGGDWILEVSSPGLERNLTKIEHFAASKGENVKLTLNDKTKLNGKIISVQDGIIELEGLSELVKFEDIKKARTFIEW